MNFERKPSLAIAAALIAGVGAGFLWGRTTGSEHVFMSPTPDNKVEQAYRRSGFGDKLMTTARRTELSLCYKTMLKSNGYDENNPTPKPGSSAESHNLIFEGKATYVFHIAEDGKMLDYELVDSDFLDKSFVRCVSKALKGARFLPPPLGINRYLAYDFVFKSDETFKREMEERKNQSPLMLVTPTPPGSANAAPATEPPTNTGAGAPPPPPPPPEKK